MKVLLICNKQTKTLLKDRFFLYSKGRQNSVEVIDNAISFDKFNIDEFKPDMVWLLVELMWEDNKYMDGYERALQLMQTNYAKKNTIQITFFSILSRKYLYHKTSGLLNIFPKSFIHNSILKDDSTLKLSSFTTERWKYIRKYGLSLSGIIDKIIHDYGDILRFENDINEKEIRRLLFALTNISDLLPDTVNDLVKKITENNFTDFRNQLFISLSSIISFSSSNSLKATTNSPQSSWKPALLLVEDDNKFAKLLISELSDSFEIKHFDNASAAIQELKKQSLLYNGLICDLELLTQEGYEQDFQGIDVIQFTQRYYPHIEINVLTNMPKSGIKDLLPNITSKQIRYKSTFKSYPKQEWIEYISFLQDELKQKARIKYLQGPTGSIWENVSNQDNIGGGLKSFYYQMKINNKKEFSSFWKDIKLSFNNVMENDERILVSFGRTEDRNNIVYSKNNKKILLILKTHLLHRLFWLNKLYNEKGISYYSIDSSDLRFFEKEFGFFNKTTAKVDKRHNAYAQLVGFSIHKEKDKSYKFIFKSLFPEEITWLRKNANINKFDFENEFPALINIYHTILKIIDEAGPHAFIKSKYPSPHYPNKMDEITNIIENLSNEVSKRSSFESRNKILNLLLEFKENSTTEYNKLDGVIKSNIEVIIKLFDTYSVYS